MKSQKRKVAGSWKIGGLLVLSVCLALAGGCGQGPFDCPDEPKKDRKVCESAKILAFLAVSPVRSGASSPGAAGGGGTAAGNAGADNTGPVCAQTPGTAAALSYVRVGRVPTGASCYYRFEIVYEPANTGPFSPSFHLVPEIGNADLYVGFDNDTTGGTTGFTSCSTTSSGGGWVRCSRNTGNADEIIVTNAAGIPKMAPGDFRIVSVYNAGTSPVDYAILAYKNGEGGH